MPEITALPYWPSASLSDAPGSGEPYHVRTQQDRGARQGAGGQARMRRVGDHDRGLRIGEVLRARRTRRRRSRRVRRPDRPPPGRSAATMTRRNWSTAPGLSITSRALPRTTSTATEAVSRIVPSAGIGARARKCCPSARLRESTAITTSPRCSSAMASAAAEGPARSRRRSSCMSLRRRQRQRLHLRARREARARRSPPPSP